MFKNLGADAGNLTPSFVDVDNTTLVQTAALVGIYLGLSLDIVDTNLELVKSMESARLVLFLRNDLETTEHDIDNDPPHTNW